MNTELFRKIDEVIQNTPEQHYQGTWESTNECGTTRCIAGWAVHLTTGAPVYDCHGGPTRESAQLASSLGVHDPHHIAAIARRLLDITPEQAGKLFFATEEHARQIVRAVATGGEPDWGQAEDSSLFDLEVE
jgi:hypothetical protein